MNSTYKYLVPIVILLFAFSPVGLVSAAAFNSTSQPASNISVVRTNSPGMAVQSNCVDCFVGYSANSTVGSVKSVSATIVVPSITKCPSSFTGLNATAWGVAIDGSQFHTSDFVSATVFGQCQNGAISYGDLWEFVNGTGSLVNIGGILTPNAGDIISFNITRSSKTYTVNVTDVTQKTQDVVTQKVNGTLNVSAECVGDMFGGESNVKFSPVAFSNCLVNGKAIGKLGKHFTLIEWTCVSSNGTANLMIASSLKSGENFKVTWEWYGR
jgi:hypothetical protein